MQQFPCPSCGRMISAEVPPGSAVQCPLCQQAVTVPPPAGATPAGYAPPPTQVGGPVTMQYSNQTFEKPAQGMAVTSLVMGILSVISCPVLLAIPGLITGIIALVRNNREPHRHGGRGMAIAGIVTSCIGLVVVPVLGAIMLPALSRARGLAKRTVCAANMRGLGQAMYIYAQDEPDGAFPDDIQSSSGPAGRLPSRFNAPR